MFSLFFHLDFGTSNKIYRNSLNDLAIKIIVLKKMNSFCPLTSREKRLLEPGKVKVIL